MLSQLPPTKKNICAIIVSHNPEKDFISNIKSTIKQLDKVVIVNNGSEKLTSAFFKKAGLMEGIHLISNSENLGQGKALNQGADWAVSQGYQWLLLLDQDSLLDPLMVQGLIGAYQNCKDRERVRIIGSNCTFRDIKEVKYKKKCRGRLYFERDVVMMSGSLLSAEAYNKIGPFREEFFIDALDLDYCLRLRKEGFKIIVACNSQMNHSVGEVATMRRFFWKNFLVTNHGPTRCYYMTRNDLILVKEYLFREPYWAIRNLFWLFFIKPGLVIFFEKNKLQKIKAIIKGFFHGLIGKLGKYQYKT